MGISGAYLRGAILNAGSGVPRENPYPGVDGAIAHALMRINARDDRPLIPPTAIHWLAPELAAAVNAHVDAEHVETHLERAIGYRDRPHREALLRAMHARMWEWVVEHGYTLAARPTVEVYHRPEFESPRPPPVNPAVPLTPAQIGLLDDAVVLQIEVHANLRVLP